MTYHGRIENGKVVLDEPVELPEGVTVEVEVVDQPDDGAIEEAQGPTLYDSLKPVIGKAVGLPPDASRNKYHYLYGGPKV